MGPLKSTSRGYQDVHSVERRVITIGESGPDRVATLCRDLAIT